VGSLSTEPVPSGLGRPRLLFFYRPASGPCRRAEGHLAQVLQRRHNHSTFELVRISVDDRADLAERFRVETVPTILVVHDRRVRGRLVNPRGCEPIAEELKPWLH
jgi:thioredoxin-like negative regulator of GroEL